MIDIHKMFICNNIKNLKYAVFSIGVLLFSFIIRILPPLNKYGLSIQEIDYIRWVRNLSGYDYFVNCVANHHGFLPPLLLKYWLIIMPAGNTDFYARILSLIIFLVLLITLLFIREEDLNNETRLITAFILSINGMVIAFSRNARLLPLFVLLIFLFSLYLYKNLKNFNLINSILLFLFTSLALITQPISLIYISAILLSALFIFDCNKYFLKGISPIIAAGLVVSPYYIWLFYYGKAEPELFPLNFMIIKRWLFNLFDDFDTILILLFILLVSINTSELVRIMRESYKNLVFRYFLFSLLFCFLFIVVISIFLPLTRIYYIIPLIVFSSFLVGFFLSKLSPKIIWAIVIVLGVKGFVSYVVFDKQVYAFWSSYGFERNILMEFRNSESYKDIDVNKSVFINLPTYHTGAFDYYKTSIERYFPPMDKFGFVEEVLNSEHLMSESNRSDLYLILWEDCARHKDPFQKRVCLINLEILNRFFTRTQIWEYNFSKKDKIVKVFRLKVKENRITQADQGASQP